MEPYQVNFILSLIRTFGNNVAKTQDAFMRPEALDTSIVATGLRSSMNIAEIKHSVIP